MMSKKAMEMHTLVALLVTMMGFFLLIYVLGTSNYSIEQELQMTRASLFAAEKYKVDKVGVQFFRLDLYLRTHSIDVPEGRYDSSQYEVMKNFANRIVDCWWEFGNGQISKDVFGKPVLATHDRCFMCFIMTVRDLDKEFTFSDLLDFMAKTPYKAKAKKFKYCKSNGDPPGCIDKDTDECDAKGGRCTSLEASISGKVSPRQICENNGRYYYPDWKCDKSGEVCCVPKNRMMTYMEYIDDGGGVIYLPYYFLANKLKREEVKNKLGYELTDRSVIKKGYKYAISFKDITKGNLGSLGSAGLMMIVGAKVGAIIGTVACAGVPLCTAIGGFVGLAIAGIIHIFDSHTIPQGILITPYPNNKWGNCAFMDES